MFDQSIIITRPTFRLLTSEYLVNIKPQYVADVKTKKVLGSDLILILSQRILKKKKEKIKNISLKILSFLWNNSELIIWLILLNPYMGKRWLSLEGNISHKIFFQHQIENWKLCPANRILIFPANWDLKNIFLFSITILKARPWPTEKNKSKVTSAIN